MAAKDNRVPLDLPLRPATELNKLTERDQAIAAKFSQIAPMTRELIANLESSNGKQVSIFAGPTGIGKSIWGPYCLLNSRAGQDKGICVTSPRSAELKRISAFIANELLRTPQERDFPAVGPGYDIGYCSRTEQNYDDHNSLLFVSDSTLIDWIISGEIARFGVVMVDEAHEQTPNMELVFALFREKLPLYPQLRLVITSATINHALFRNFFGGAESVFECLSAENVTRFTVHQHWPEQAGYRNSFKRDHVADAVADVVLRIRQDISFTTLNIPDGDILVFVPTRADVYKTIGAIKQRHLDHFDTFPCHAKWTFEEEQAFRESENAAARAFRRGEPTRPQRVIVATNFAETSMTAANLRFVIDSGLVLQPTWDPTTCSREYRSTWHTQAGCIQRRGRVGRLHDGEYFPLFSQNQWSRMRSHPLPEVAQQPLDKFLLRAAASGIKDLQSFRWLGENDSPPKEIERAKHSLSIRGALDRNGSITERGRQLHQIRAATIDLCSLLETADTFGCSSEVATFLAFANQPGTLFHRTESGLLGSHAFADECVDDLEYYLRIFNQWLLIADKSSETKNTWASSFGMNTKWLSAVERAVRNSLRQFNRRTKGKADVLQRDFDFRRLDRVRQVFVHCLSEWIFIRDPANRRLFVPLDQEQCPCKEPVVIDRDSCVVADDDIEVFVCLQRSRLRTRGTLRAKHFVRVSQSWLSIPRAASIVQLATHLNASEPLVPMPVVDVRFDGPKERREWHDWKFTQNIIRVVAVRPAADPGLWLCRECEHRYPVLVQCSPEASNRSLSGNKFSATVRKWDRHLNVVRASANSHYRVGEFFLDAPIERKLRDGIVIALDSNSKGFLPRNQTVRGIHDTRLPVVVTACSPPCHYELTHPLCLDPYNRREFFDRAMRCLNAEDSREAEFAAAFFLDQLYLEYDEDEIENEFLSEVASGHTGLTSEHRELVLREFFYKYRWRHVRGIATQISSGARDELLDELEDNIDKLLNYEDSVWNYGQLSSVDNPLPGLYAYETIVNRAHLTLREKRRSFKYLLPATEPAVSVSISPPAPIAPPPATTTPLPRRAVEQTERQLGTLLFLVLSLCLLTVAFIGWSVLRSNRYQNRLPLFVVPGNENGLTAIAFSPDSRRLLVGRWDGSVSTWSLASGERHRMRQLPVHVSAVASDGKSERFVIGGVDGELVILDQELEVLLSDLYFRSTSMGALGFEALKLLENELLVAATFDGLFHIVDIPSKRPLISFGGPTVPGLGHSLRGQFRHERSLFVTDGVEAIESKVGDDRWVVVRWNVATQEADIIHEESLNRSRSKAGLVAASADGQTIIIGRNNEVVRLSPEGGVEKDVCRLQYSPIKLRLSDDGRYVIAVAIIIDDYDSPESMLSVWDIENRKCILECTELPFLVGSIEMSPDNSRIAASCTDGNVRIWKTGVSRQD